MARLFADENFPLPVVDELRQLGHDVLTIQEAGLANQRFPDDAVLDFAKEADRAVVTLNRKHFVRLHKKSSHHKGIIVCSIDLDFAGQAGRIHKAVEQGESHSLDEKLIRINRPA
jgi:hypothetical protein